MQDIKRILKQLELTEPELQNLIAKLNLKRIGDLAQTSPPILYNMIRVVKSGITMNQCLQIIELAKRCEKNNSLFGWYGTDIDRPR